jgi:hypothetical protein
VARSGLIAAHRPPARVSAADLADWHADPPCTSIEADI